ncbi:hypothetical protein [Bradyrhizobium sp. ARR65]|uniref:hypothetical protein n=1 Tax=Bradyrhizobium sp. ARR65 TaxID=1040989 RepID=UPI00046625A8|nr:hypothetical protein [Bradyrhizobium sp. ARR65]
MKSNTLFTFVVLMIAAYSVQAAERPKPTEPPVSHFQGTCDSDPDGKKFAEKACYTSYNPGRAGMDGGYRPPACDKRKVSDQQKEVLAKAYSRAPDYMKGKLCRLTQLFVTKANLWGPWGWGFWEGADRPPGKGVYLAISDSELATRKSVAETENETVDRLVQLRGRFDRARLLRLRSSAPADPELTVLAGLAHELGHILLADSNGDGVDPAHPRREVSGPPQSACFEDAFINASWDSRRFHQNMRRWVDFGEQYNNRPKNPDVSLSRLRTLARQGRVGAANDVIRSVYSSHEFTSPAAIPNPIEDVAETYKYKVLADATPNQAIEFRLGGQDVNVSDLLNSDVLAKKVECLRALGFLTGQP